MGRSRQIFLLLGVLVSVAVAEDNVTAEARSDKAADSPFVQEVVARQPMDKVGMDGPANSNNNNNGGVYMAGQPYINYQAASVDEDDEYQQALHAAGVRTGNADTARSFNGVPVPQNSFPYVTNFNPYGTSAVVAGGIHQGQASNNSPFVSQPPVQKAMDNKPVGGYTDQQFDGNVNQASFKTDTLTQSQNFVDNNNNNDFVNFNGQQAAFQGQNSNDFASVSNNNNFASQQQQNQQQQNQDFNNQQNGNQQTISFTSANLNGGNANGQKLTGTKLMTTPQLAYLMMPGGYPQLFNGGNLFGGQMPLQGNMFPNPFMPHMMMNPQMAGNGFNMNMALKQALAKQQMQNQMPAVSMTRNMVPGAQQPLLSQASQMNFNGMLSPNTLSMPMFYGNMGNMANKLSMPHPGAFSPMIYPGQMFMPAMGYNNPFFPQRTRGKGTGKNKPKSENRDDRDDLEDLFEDDAVDQDSAE